MDPNAFENLFVHAAKGAPQTLRNDIGMPRKRKLCAVFKTFVWAMVTGQPNTLFANLYSRGKTGAQAAKFLKNGAGNYLNAKLGADPLGVWVYEDDGSVWFEDTYNGTPFWVLLRGTTSKRGRSVDEIGLTLTFY
jgi:hypothetical protein